MDETKGTIQGTPQTAGQPSGGEVGTTSGSNTPKQYTEEQHSKILSDTKAHFGRERVTLTKERDTLKAELESTVSRLEELEGHVNEAELEKARDNPELLKTYQQRQDFGKRVKDLKAKEREIAQREAQLKVDTEAVAGEIKGAMVARIAVKHGLNIQQVESWGVTDEEALDKVAGDFAKGKTGEPTVDSGISSGNLSDLQTREKANKDFSEGKISEKAFKGIVQVKS